LDSWVWYSPGPPSRPEKKVDPPRPTNEECLACHGDPTMSKDVGGKPVSISVNPDAFKASIHSGMFACVDCHTDVKTSPHENTPAKISCATCHADQQAAYERSYHAKALRPAICKRLPVSPATAVRMNCCRQRSQVAREPREYPRHLWKLSRQKYVMEASGHSAHPFSSYLLSVHGRAVAAGSEKAAVCTDCHGSHEILAALTSTRPSFASTCRPPARSVRVGQAGVHESIHGQAIARGNSQAPVCTDCQWNPLHQGAPGPEFLRAAANLSQRHLRSLP